MIDGNQFVNEDKLTSNLTNNGEDSKVGGKLWLGFSNPRSEEILQPDTTGTNTAREVLRS